MGRWSRLLAMPFVDFVNTVDGMRVLDVGCGTGALTDELLARLPFDDHVFDVAVAQLVVHFMAGPVAGLTEMPG